MNELIEFGLLAFTSLFTMINPLGITPVYLTMTKGLDSQTQNRIAVKAVITALIILLVFAFTGNFIFKLFGISVDGLRIVGGIIFLMVGYDMLQARLIRTKTEAESVKEYAEDIAITPLAIPMICGPGAITVAIVLYNDAKSPEMVAVLISVIVLILTIELFGLIGAKSIKKFLGENGNKVLLRLMGLIVMVIAVEFLIAGLRPILRDILKIQ
ncbi:MAG: MarC family protein [Melioribacteraceae bacterium]|nr:MarC family protein [Melioribacteraceae bacterium]MCF8265283.1 MarC family protein [Melioribacteraceae bacterium]MCF8412612.1 MarC family protein [Melioribacteraceae bacterium]MCF8431514.1 MarC family protein [Melioribacteraceae bacterium]